MNISKFLEIEKKYDLYDKKSENVNYWVYERFGIWNYRVCTERLKLFSSQSNAKQNISGTARTLVNLLKNCIFRGRIRQRHYDICFVAHERRCRVGEHYECIYTEHLSRHFENCITLEEPFELKHFKPVINRNLYYTDYILVTGELYSRFHMIFKTNLYRRIYRQIRGDTEAAIKEINDAYGLEMPTDEICRLLTRRVLIGKNCKKSYEKLVRRINPRLIVEVVHYNLQNMMINEIAYKYGIKTIELQHGTMHDEHIAYQYGIDQTIPQLPQALFTFSEYWNQVIHLPQASTQVTAMGFPYFEEKAAQSLDDRDDRVTNILFLSQGTIGKYLYQLACELDGLLDRSQYHIIYKLHPAEYSDWQERYGISGKGTHMEVIDTPDTDLYNLFAKSSIQVGVYSTALYEGIGFGVRTYLYDIAHADTMDRLVQMGAAEYICSAEDLLHKLSTDKDTRNIKEILWKSNAFPNICAEIDGLLRNEKQETVKGQK